MLHSLIYTCLLFNRGALKSAPFRSALPLFNINENSLTIFICHVGYVLTSRKAQPHSLRRKISSRPDSNDAATHNIPLISLAPPRDSRPDLGSDSPGSTGNASLPFAWRLSILPAHSTHRSTVRYFTVFIWGKSPCYSLCEPRIKKRSAAVFGTSFLACEVSR